MNICQHEIKESEIVGIGPLMIHTSSDPAMRALYKEKQLLFWLHLRNVSIKIESDWFCFAEHLTAEELEKNKAKYAAWTDSYDKAKDRILRSIS